MEHGIDMAIHRNNMVMLDIDMGYGISLGR